MMKINILDAIREYDDEQARLAEEMMEQEAQASKTVTAESDPLWDCWYHFASTYEPETGKYDEPKATEISMTAETGKAKTDSWDSEDHWNWSYNVRIFEPVYTWTPGKNRAKRAKRRKATAMHKRKIRRNVTAIWGNYGKREEEDMRNWSYKKLKDGDRIIRPKSQSKKVDMYLKKAMKTNALPKDLHDKIVEHLKWVSQYCKRNISGRLYVDQFNRGREEAVKRELDEMMKNNINIFQPISDYRLIKGQWVKKTAA